jgi:hypothetical protein
VDLECYTLVRLGLPVSSSMLILDTGLRTGRTPSMKNYEEQTCNFSITLLFHAFNFERKKSIIQLWEIFLSKIEKALNYLSYRDNS